MLRKTALFVCAVGLASTAVLAAEEPMPATTKDVLSTLSKVRPRLMLTDPRLGELRELAKTDKLLASAVRNVIDEANSLAKQPTLEHKLIGPRLLNVSRECVRRVYAWGLAWRWTGDELYARRVKRELLTVCAFADWNPSHFLDTAEMSHAVGVGYDWLHGWLDDETRQTIRAGLIRLGMEPGLACYRRKGGWAGSSFNWNQVCNCGLTVGALAIAETDPDCARTIVGEAIRSLPKALDTYDPDGAWPEGPGYWNYATRYTCYGLTALQTALGTDFGLADRKGLTEAALFPLYAAGPTGLFLNFADVGERSRLRNLPPLFWLARRYDVPVAAEAERQMIARRGADALDVIWYVPPPPRKPEPLKLDKLFRGSVELAVFRSQWDDPNALFAGIKAGYNQVNHGHLDLGNFEMDALGVRWVRDLGSDNYNLPGYWDGRRAEGKRWAYYRLNTLSHSVPLIDGRNQNPDARSKITGYKSTPARAQAIVDLTSAYKPAASKVTRGLAVVGGRRAVLVQDEIDLTGAHDVTWALTTDAKLDLAGDRATLTLDGRTLTAQLLAPAGATFAKESAEQSTPQKTNRGVRRLLVKLPAQNGSVTVAVFLAPAWPDGKQPAAPKLSPLAEW